MAEFEEKRNSNPRDLLQRFNSVNHLPRKFEKSTHDEEEEEEREIELSLGLSLNGRFGVDPMRARILSRSSSVSDFMSTNEQSAIGARVGPPPPPPPPQVLMRTCSLPPEGEEEWRKRKEAQSMRRMEAKRKRVEKIRRQASVESNWGENFQFQAQSKGIELKGERGIPIPIPIPPIPSSQGSIGSGGSGSSGISESRSQPNQGTNGCTEARSPASVQSLPIPKQNEHKPLVTPTEKSADFVGAAMKSPLAKLTVNNDEANEIMRNMLADMPCVSTRELGPNGKRIEGFLYRYRKGEEVRIVCVCHGSFLSPAEFVKHAGGGDVAQPLKHIVVSPSPLL